MDRIFVANTGNYSLDWLKRSSSDNIAVTWYDNDSKTALTGTTNISWTYTRQALSAAASAGDRKISVADATNYSVYDNVCIAGRMNSIMQIDDTDLILQYPLLESLSTADYIYPTAATLAIHSSVSSWTKYYITASDIHLSVWVFGSEDITIPITIDDIRDEYPSIISKVELFRNVKNLIRNTWLNHTIPLFLRQTEEAMALPHFPGELGTLLMLDTVDRIIVDLQIAEQQNDYSDVLREIRDRKQEQWNSVMNWIHVENSENTLQEMKQQYSHTVKWSRC